MLALPAVAVMCLIIGPAIATAFSSFQTWTGLTSTGWGSTAGYEVAFQSQRLALLGTVAIRSGIVASLALILCMPFLDWIVRLKSIARMFVLAFLVLPYFVSDIGRAFGWRFLLDTTGLGLGFGAVAAAQLAVGLPLTVLFGLAKLPKPGNSIWRSTDDFGVPWSMRMMKVTIPMALPGAAVGSLCTFWIALASSVEPMVLDAPQQRSIGQIISGLRSSGEFSATSAFAILILCAFVITWALVIVGKPVFVGACRLARSFRFDLIPQNSNKPVLPRKSPAPYQFFILTMMGATCLALVSAGLLGTVPLALKHPLSQAVALRGEGGTALQNSGLLALLVGILASLVAFSTGFLWWNRKARIFAFGFLGLLALLPGDTLALGLLQGFKLLGVEGSASWLPLLGLVAYALPFACVLVLAANSTIPLSVLNAAQELGTSRFHFATAIVLGMNRSAVFSAGLLAALLAFNEYVITSYLSGAKPFWSQYVLGGMRSGADPSIYYVGLGTVILGLLLFACSVFIARRSIIKVT